MSKPKLAAVLAGALALIGATVAVTLAISSNDDGTNTEAAVAVDTAASTAPTTRRPPTLRDTDADGVVDAYDPKPEDSSITSEDQLAHQGSNSLDCESQGINREEGREGICVRGSNEFHVVNRANPVRLRGLRAKLLDLTTTDVVASETLGPAQASGTFIIATLEIKNRLRVPASFDSWGEQTKLVLADRHYEEEFDVANGQLEGSFVFLDDPEIQPGEAKVGKVVFDVPTRAARHLERNGNLWVADFGERIGDATTLGVIRLYQ